MQCPNCRNTECVDTAILGDAPSDSQQLRDISGSVKAKGNKNDPVLCLYEYDLWTHISRSSGGQCGSSGDEHGHKLLIKVHRMAPSPCILRLTIITRHSFNSGIPGILLSRQSKHRLRERPPEFSFLIRIVTLIRQGNF